MSKMFQVYGIGQALIPVLPPPLPFQNPPTSNQTNYEIGQVVFTPPLAPTAFYMYAGAGNWSQFASGTGAIIAIAPTAGQIAVTTVAGTATISLPSVLVAPGSVTSTTTLTATLGAITASNGNFVFGTAGNKTVYTSVASTVTAGANSAGSVALASGTATVATTAVTASSLIRLSRQGANSSTALGTLTITSISAGTNFVITSLLAATPADTVTGDTSIIFWEIVN